MPSRRSVLVMLGVAVPAPLPAAPARAAPVPISAAGCPAVPRTPSSDVYDSNTALYADTVNCVEGRDYGRRYRRHPVLDLDPIERTGLPRTAVIAPHGGGIEFGTSELCLAIAGYDPAHPDLAPTSEPVHDYWMFEGRRSGADGVSAEDNSVLHVTSTHCDDPVARSLCAGALNALALHGCKAAQIDPAFGPEVRAVLVGGRSDELRSYLREELGKLAGAFIVVDGRDHPTLSGTSPWNISNRTLLDMGAQLEISTALRRAMFTVNTAAGRKNSTTDTFTRFVAAARTAIGRLEAGQQQ
jgi:phage replication-related protein YjqB (UPF0714/DUF867 family)